MTVSVKIRGDTKRRLERIQARLSSMFGQNLSAEQVLDAAVRVGEAEIVQVAAINSPVKLPLSAAAKRRILSSAWDLGVTDTERDIDETLYSDEAIHGGRKAP